MEENYDWVDKYVAKTTDSSVPGIPAFAIYSAQERKKRLEEITEENPAEKELILENPVSKISIRLVEGKHSGRKNYVIFRRRLPSHVIDEFLDSLPSKSSTFKLKSLMTDYALDEVQGLYEKAGKHFSVEDYIHSVGLMKSKEIYPGMEDMILNSLLKSHPEYEGEVIRYRSERSAKKELQAVGPSSEEE